MMQTARPSELKRSRFAGLFLDSIIRHRLLHFGYPLTYRILLVLGQGGGHEDVVKHIYLRVDDQPQLLSLKPCLAFILKTCTKRLVERAYSVCESLQGLGCGAQPLFNIILEL